MPTSNTVTLILSDCVPALKAMATGSVDAVITDPPYGIGFDYASHDDSREKWFELMQLVVPELKRVARFVVMPCCGIDRLGWWYANIPPEWIIVWYKDSTGHRSAIGFNDWEAHLTWGFPRRPMHDYFRVKPAAIKAEALADGNNHSCPKPVAYTDWLVEKSTMPGDTVLDPFLGSGTTGVSCVKLGRKFIGIEKDQNYLAIAERRIEIERSGSGAWMFQNAAPPVQRAKGT